MPCFSFLVIRTAVTRLAIKLFERKKAHMNIVKFLDRLQLSAEVEMEDRSLQPATSVVAAVHKKSPRIQFVQLLGRYLDAITTK